MSAPAVERPRTATSPNHRGTDPLTLDHDSVVDPAVLAQVVKVAAETAATHDAEGTFPREVLTALRETGLLGLTVPVEYGGPGGTVRDMLAVSYALARECLSAGMIFTMHQQQVIGLVEHATEALRSRLLPEVAAGRRYLASVTTEPGKGGHLLTAGAALEQGADELKIDRMAPVVTGGGEADGFLISMRECEDAAANRVSLVYAGREDVQITPLGGWDALGMRATGSAPMRLVGAVPTDHLVGAPGEFRDVVVRTFGPLAHIGWAVCWLGSAAGALSRTVTHLRAPETRRQRSLTSELLRHRLSHVRVRLDVVHALIARGLQVYDGTAGVAVDSAAAAVQLNSVKIAASTECVAAVDELVEVVGMRHGYLKNSALALERSLRDLRSASLNYSNDRLHAVTGAQVLMDRDVGFV